MASSSSKRLVRKAKFSSESEVGSPTTEMPRSAVELGREITATLKLLSAVVTSQPGSNSILYPSSAFKYLADEASVALVEWTVGVGVCVGWADRAVGVGVCVGRADRTVAVGAVVGEAEGTVDTGAVVGGVEGTVDTDAVAGRAEEAFGAGASVMVLDPASGTGSVAQAENTSMSAVPAMTARREVLIIIPARHPAAFVQCVNSGPSR